MPAPRSPAFFVASLLALLAALMAAHLGVLWLGALECDRYADVLLERLVAGAETRIDATNTECNQVEADFAEAAGQYVAVILALLSGAGYAASRRDGG